MGELSPLQDNSAVQLNSLHERISPSLTDAFQHLAILYNFKSLVAYIEHISWHLLFQPGNLGPVFQLMLLAVGCI